MTLPRDHPAHPSPRAVHFDTGGRPHCGHPDFHRLTTEQAEVTCGRCLMRLAGLNSTSGRTWAEQPHGTLAAARRHYRRGEKLCRSCKQAESRHNADYRARRAAA